MYQADPDIAGIGVSVFYRLGMNTHMENLQYRTSWSM